MCLWRDCRILRGCVIQCGCALDRLQDFEGLCYVVWVCLWTDCRILRGCVIQCGCASGADCRILRGCVIQCGCALDRLQDFEGLCGLPWKDCMVLRGCVIQRGCAFGETAGF